MTETNFTERELQVITDTEFLSAKVSALSKIDLLLSETQTALAKVFEGYKLPTPQRENFKTHKISKGENYLGFPYRVLDYPAFFTSENIFAYRTMFWWGNFFSVTIHLQGDVLDFYREKIIDNISLLENRQIYLAVGKTPWQYHYGSNNYILLNSDTVGIINDSAFLKLSKKMYIDDLEKLPSFSAEFLTQILKLLCD